MSIVDEAPGFIQVFSNGTVKRFVPDETALGSTDQHCQNSNTYKYKDVTIDPIKPITARIFVPAETVPEASAQVLLPVVVYFHGGGFCIGSTTWLGYHVFLGDLSAAAKVIVLSVDYRLAPENKLPIAYEDCYAALEWLSSNTSAGGSEYVKRWLERADLSRVFLSGDSAGGNIAHQVAVKALKNEIFNVRIKGIVPIHPYFGSVKRTELELSDGSADDVAMNDMFWKLSLPDGSDRDYYGCNFKKWGGEGDIVNWWGLFPEVLVFVAGKDFLKERGVMYAEFLKNNGVKGVSLVENVGESHVYHVWDPKSEATRLLQKQFSDFIRSL